jgi:acyl-CoA synthetase (AMP-forming)/AMP-acid ligase II
MADVAGQLTADLVPQVHTRLMIDGVVDGWESYEDVVGEQPATPIDDEAEGDFVLYSSGTTGRPKGIQRALRLAPLGEGLPSATPLLQMLGFGDGDVYLTPAPLYHTAPVAWSTCAQRLGGTSVIMEHFDPLTTLETIERYGVTHGQFVPTMFVRMLRLPDEDRLRPDLSSLQRVIHAAAPCPVPVKQQMIEWWGPIIDELYSSTEGVGITWITAEDWLAHPGSVGRPLMGTPHVLDDDGNELAAGEIGTIWFEGIPSFEYRNDEDKTRSAVDERGWRTVGDVGRVDDDGYVYLTDRRAYLILSGGVNIYPQESENVLITHPRVADVAVFGVPNEEMGQEVKAVVQPIDWADAGPALEEELIAFCRDHLAHYKCPRSVDFDPELPRLDSGKLYKRVLQDRYW